MDFAEGVKEYRTYRGDFDAPDRYGAEIPTREVLLRSKSANVFGDLRELSVTPI
ncbi:hypothetical protein TSACC_263 [Terrimicrobium sacchariphilum]|jgi:hypothetical protein|uniref:Uncharacterized protein n=1 Tax=Terrimicrobium sacchariphilum TaxID=690879 RepID=A0A146G1D2_TERSA|nr:hypothetical protein TSACC_263 [Terrimicrobium sacchariphilum]